MSCIPGCLSTSPIVLKGIVFSASPLVVRAKLKKRPDETPFISVIVDFKKTRLI